MLPVAPEPRRRPRSKRVRTLARCRCDECGYDLGGLQDNDPRGRHITCPECGALFDTMRPPRLVEWPGDAAARKRMIAYTPYGMAVFGLLAFLVYAWSRGTAGPVAYGVALGLALLLTWGEAIVQAWRLANGCFGRKEVMEKFIELSVVGTGLTLAVWAPLGLIFAAAVALI